MAPSDIPTPHDVLFRALLSAPHRTAAFLRDHLPNAVALGSKPGAGFTANPSHSQGPNRFLAQAAFCPKTPDDGHSEPHKAERGIFDFGFPVLGTDSDPNLSRHLIVVGFAIQKLAETPAHSRPASVHFSSSLSSPPDSQAIAETTQRAQIFATIPIVRDVFHQGVEQRSLSFLRPTIFVCCIYVVGWF
ncbi:hypothetical protein [Ruegeria atlantica]|uniref:hypothetical protein n=1 Tax=Ruegeria atlantica TaxID=81569 RepID=UPI001481B124|nr:hypothetical protein [Ruegeria atlantica]